MKDAPKDSLYLKRLIFLTGEYNNASQYSRAISTGLQALDLATELGFETGAANALGNLGVTYYYKGLPDSSYYFQSRSLAIRERLGDKKGIAKASCNIALIEMNRGRFKEARALFEKSIGINEQLNSREDLANNLFNCSILYYYEGNFPQVLNYCFRALKINQELNLTSAMIGCNNSIAIIYAEQKNYPKAMEFFQKNLVLSRQISDKDLEIGSLSNIAGIHLENKRFDKGLELLKEALAISVEIGQKDSEIDINKSIADVYVLKHDAASALPYATNALQMSGGSNDINRRVAILATLSKVYLSKGDYTGALKYAQESEALSEQVSSVVSKKNLEQILSETYEKLGKYKAALLHFKKFIALKDSIFNEEKNKELIQKQMNFDFERQISAQKAEHERQQLEHVLKRKQQRIIIISAISGFILLGLFSFFLYQRFRLTKKQKLVIEEQKLVVEHKSQQLQEANKEVLDSIVYAKRLQEAILPPQKLIQASFPRNFILYRPKAIVAGDFYWYEKVNDTAFLAVADCTGHGVPGAMVSVVCSNALTRTVKELKLTDPGEILDKVRALVIETFEKSESEVKDGMDISLIAIQKPQSPKAEDEIQVMWAGANNPLIFYRDEKLEQLTADKQPIGVSEISKPFTTHRLNFKSGDNLYLLTDGFADQFGGPRGKKFKLLQLKQILLQNINGTPAEQKLALDTAFEAWSAGQEQVDDVTIIGVNL
jgi:tetratricopeptide (TPR) repeat protein